MLWGMLWGCCEDVVVMLWDVMGMLWGYCGEVFGMSCLSNTEKPYVSVSKVRFSICHFFFLKDAF